VHIPDGYLSPSTCAVMYGAAAPFWYLSVQRLQKLLTTRLVPLISIMAAFSFVIMMFNLPLPGGTTGHAVGMGLAAIVLGPWGAIISITIALILQAIFFGDGGILSIGANCFNMAIVGALVAYLLYRLFAGRAPLTAPRRAIAGAVAGYIAINISAICAAIEFGIQPLLFKDANGVPLYSFYPLSVALPAMMIGHLTFAGIAEAVVTGGVVAYLQRADPALLRISAPRDVAEEVAAPTTVGRSWRPLVIGLVVLALLSPLGLLASGTAWGEWGSGEVGVEQIGYHLRGLNETDRAALASELTRLGSATSDASVSSDLKSAGALLGSNDQTGATTPLDRQLATLRTADSKQYPQIAALAANVKEPSGLKQFSSFWTAPIPDYAPTFMKSEIAGYIISALVGIVLVGGVAALVGRLVARRTTGAATGD
jgi:cobalt/nickel transport system permease protein